MTRNYKELSISCQVLACLGSASMDIIEVNCEYDRDLRQATYIGLLPADRMSCRDLTVPAIL